MSKPTDAELYVHGMTDRAYRTFVQPNGDVQVILNGPAGERVDVTASTVQNWLAAHGRPQTLPEASTHGCAQDYHCRGCEAVRRNENRC